MKKIPRSIIWTYWTLVIFLAGLLVYQLLERSKAPDPSAPTENPAAAWQFAEALRNESTTSELIDYLLEIDYLWMTQEESTDDFLGAYDLWYKNLNGVRWLAARNDAAGILYFRLTRESAKRAAGELSGGTRAEQYRLQALCTFLVQETYYSALSEKRQAAFDSFLAEARKGNITELRDDFFDLVDVESIPPEYLVAPLYVKTVSVPEDLAREILSKRPGLDLTYAIRLFPYESDGTAENTGIEYLYLIPEPENGRIAAVSFVMRFSNGTLSVTRTEKSPDNGGSTPIEWLEYLSVRTSPEHPLEMVGVNGSFLFKIGDTVYRPLLNTFSLEDLKPAEDDVQAEVIMIPLE